MLRGVSFRGAVKLLWFVFVTTEMLQFEHGSSTNYFGIHSKIAVIYGRCSWESGSDFAWSITCMCSGGFDRPTTDLMNTLSIVCSCFCTDINWMCQDIFNSTEWGPCLFCFLGKIVFFFSTENSNVGHLHAFLVALVVRFDQSTFWIVDNNPKAFFCFSKSFSALHLVVPRHKLKMHKSLELLW